MKASKSKARTRKPITGQCPLRTDEELYASYVAGLGINVFYGKNADGTKNKYVESLGINEFASSQIKKK